MDVELFLPADRQASELVNVGDRLFDDPAESAQAGDAFGAAQRNDRHDAACGDLFADGMGVLAPVGQECLEASPGCRVVP